MSAAADGYFEDVYLTGISPEVGIFSAMTSSSQQKKPKALEPRAKLPRGQRNRVSRPGGNGS